MPASRQHFPVQIGFLGKDYEAVVVEYDSYEQVPETPCPNGQRCLACFPLHHLDIALLVCAALACST